MLVKLNNHGTLLLVDGILTLEKVTSGGDRAYKHQYINVTYTNGQKVSLHYGYDDTYHGYSSVNQKRRDADFKQLEDLLVGE